METEIDFDLRALEDVTLEYLPEGDAFGTWGTASSVGTGSCPISSASSAMTASN